MRVEVNLFSTLQKSRFKKNRIQLPVNSRVTDLLNRLEILTDEVGILIINKKDATFDSELNEGDIITMIPPIGGG